MWEPETSMKMDISVINPYWPKWKKTRVLIVGTGLCLIGKYINMFFSSLFVFISCSLSFWYVLHCTLKFSYFWNLLSDLCEISHKFIRVSRLWNRYWTQTSPISIKTYLSCVLLCTFETVFSNQVCICRSFSLYVTVRGTTYVITSHLLLCLFVMRMVLCGEMQH
jgi:hypothetical protein